MRPSLFFNHGRSSGEPVSSGPFFAIPYQFQGLCRKSPAKRLFPLLAERLLRIKELRGRPGTRLFPFRSAGSPSALIEDLSQFDGECLRSERLLQETKSGTRDSLGDVGGLSIAGHKQHLDSCLVGLDQIRQLGARHSRHDDIGEQQVDRAAAILSQFERTLGSLRHQNRVTETGQDSSRQLSNLLLIFHQEYGFRAVLRHRFNGLLAVRYGLRRRSRQQDPEGGALSQFRLDYDSTT